jgi:hypothetical protein
MRLICNENYAKTPFALSEKTVAPFAAASRGEKDYPRQIACRAEFYPQKRFALDREYALLSAVKLNLAR